MLVIRRVKVRDVDLSDQIADGVRIASEYFRFAVEFAENRIRQRDISANAGERIFLSAAKLSDPRVAVLVKALEYPRGVRVN